MTQREAESTMQQASKMILTAALCKEMESEGLVFLRLPWHPDWGLCPSPRDTGALHSWQSGDRDAPHAVLQAALILTLGF